MMSTLVSTDAVVEAPDDQIGGIVAFLRKTNNEKTVDIELLHPEVKSMQATVLVRNVWQKMKQISWSRFSITFKSCIIPIPIVFCMQIVNTEELITFSIPHVQTGIPIKCNAISQTQPQNIENFDSQLKADTGSATESFSNGNLLHNSAEEIPSTHVDRCHNNELNIIEDSNIPIEHVNGRFTRSGKAGKKNTENDLDLRKKKRRVKSHAETTLPEDLQIKKSTIPNAGKGVFAKKDIPAGYRFGPYEGDRCEKAETENEEKAAYTWEIFENGKVKYCIDGSDENKSNWLRYINCARDEQEQNLYAFQFEDDIFYRTKKPISAGTELLIWYGRQYGEDLGIHTAAGGEVAHGFVCKACDLSFSTKYRLYIHFKKCRKKHEHPLVNPTNLPSRTVLIKRTRDLDRPKTCSVCGYTNQSITRVDTHIDKNHPQSEKFVCEFCGKVYRIKYLLNLHRKSHFNNGSMNCPLCERHFRTRAKLFDHIGTHSGGRLFFCNGCGQITTHDRIEQVLTKDNSSDNPIAYSCDYCAKDYTLEELYATHYGTYDSITRQHQCEECGQRFDTLRRWRDHKLKHATNPKIYGCPTCKKEYASQIGLKKHTITCNSASKTTYPCDKCNKTYSSISGWERHRLVHIGEKIFVCSICGKSFLTESQLLMHKRVHTGEKPHTCDICNQSFSQSCSLTRHRRVHTGEKPYKCKLCDEGFRQGSLLKYHMKKKHVGETGDEV